MNQKTVLVSGASIAGPTLAFWLTRFGFKTTIIERADSLKYKNYLLMYLG